MCTFPLPSRVLLNSNGIACICSLVISVQITVLTTILYWYVKATYTKSYIKWLYKRRANKCAVSQRDSSSCQSNSKKNDAKIDFLNSVNQIFYHITSNSTKMSAVHVYAMQWPQSILTISSYVSTFLSLNMQCTYTHYSKCAKEKFDMSTAPTTEVTRADVSQRKKLETSRLFSFQKIFFNLEFLRKTSSVQIPI